MKKDDRRVCQCNLETCRVGWKLVCQKTRAKMAIGNSLDRMIIPVFATTIKNLTGT